MVVLCRQLSGGGIEILRMPGILVACQWTAVQRRKKLGVQKLGSVALRRINLHPEEKDPEGTVGNSFRRNIPHSQAELLRLSTCHRVKVARMVFKSGGARVYNAKRVSCPHISQNVKANVARVCLLPPARHYELLTDLQVAN